MSKFSKPLEPSDIRIEHFSDWSIRRLLQDPEYVRGLIEIIAPELATLLDFSRGAQQNRSFISDALRERESDVLLRVPFQGTPDSEELLIYILIEHQSTVDSTMGFRLLSYMMEIWQEQWRMWQSGAGVRRAFGSDLTDTILHRGWALDFSVVIDSNHGGPRSPWNDLYRRLTPYFWK